MKATSLGNGQYKFVVPENAGTIDNTWKIIWNDGSGNQTQDLVYRDRYLYTGTDKGRIQPTTLITAICDSTMSIEHITASGNRARKVIVDGRLYIILPDGRCYDILANLLPEGEY